MIGSFRFTRNRVAIVLALILTAVVTTLANQSLFSDATAQPESGGGEVRIAARSLSDGRVEVGLQEQLDGSWSRLQRPKARFLGLDPELDRWYFSSPLQVAARTDNSRPVMNPEAISDPGFACVVTHGRVSDAFWRRLELSATIAARSMGVPVRMSHHPDGADQAAAITQCVDDGAFAIASTIADPNALLPALRAAHQAGAQIVTFNSGSEFASQSGSSFHIGLNETAVGRTAGEQFDSASISGTVLCIIHEQDNVGLNERCQGLEQAYSGGEVEILELDESLSDIERSERIRERLSADSPPAAIFTLNSNVATAAIQAAHATGQRPRIGTVGLDFSQIGSMLPVVRETVAFSMDNTAGSQAYLTIAELRRKLDFILAGNPNPGNIASRATTVADLRPRVFNVARVLENTDFLEWLAEVSGN